jgi:hypothetical protein
MATSPLKIVRLDGLHAPSPTFTVPHTYLEYPTTSDLATIAPRIGDADVVITTRYVLRLLMWSGVLRG